MDLKPIDRNLYAAVSCSIVLVFFVCLILLNASGGQPIGPPPFAAMAFPEEPADNGEYDEQGDYDAVAEESFPQGHQEMYGADEDQEHDGHPVSA